MKDFLFKEDTICAIATPVGEGGIGIIKISGPETLPIARKLFRPRRSLPSLESHRLYHGWIQDPSTGRTVDEVLLSYMAAPHTYTCEDVVEINCHSGFAVLNQVLELVLKSGSRLAEPGEFTRRAFINGRIDLTQAEAVSELIHSRSQESLLLLNRHLAGEFREMLLSWRDTLLQVQSEIEAHIDFAEDMDEDAVDLEPVLDRIEQDLIRSMKRVVEDYESGRLLREGLTVVLAGKPNVGKSSLLNVLLGKDRAIVTPFPGTTRDVIEDSFILSGILVRVLDTAGIRQKPDEIESMGIERSLRSAQDADLVLWLIDQSRPLDEEDQFIFQAIGSLRHVILLNKADLPAVVSVEAVKQQFDQSTAVHQLSVFHPSDIDQLRTYLSETFLKKPLEMSRSMISANLRHKECLETALGSLSRSCELLRNGGYGDLVSYELRSARVQLEGILGLEADEELLDRIFSRFCIGK